MFSFGAFAEENSKPTKGDVNFDGRITASDARFVLRMSVGLETLSDENRNLADIDSTGSVTASDARIILRISVALDSLDNYVINVYLTNEITDNSYFVYEDSVANIKVLSNRDFALGELHIKDSDGNTVYSVKKLI